MVAKVVATAFGGPEVLVVIDEEVGEPGPGEVLLGIRAAGTNPIDYRLYAGARGTDPSLLPMSLGLESSGVVLAVGDGAEGPAGEIHVGDEVTAFRAPGSYAERLIVPASAVVPKPPTLTFEEGAGLMLAGTTAVHALVAVGVTRGETLLLHGAAGGVGLLAVQLAVAQGVRVIGTASEGAHARSGPRPVSTWSSRPPRASSKCAWWRPIPWRKWRRPIGSWPRGTRTGKSSSSPDQGRVPLTKGEPHRATVPSSV